MDTPVLIAVVTTSAKLRHAVSGPVVDALDAETIRVPSGPPSETFAAQDSLCRIAMMAGRNVVVTSPPALWTAEVEDALEALCVEHGYRMGAVRWLDPV
jgi:hypothetical protein